MKKALFLFITLAFSLNAQNYAWPTKPFEQQHGINGTFCENRPSGDVQRHHFHDGVDIALAEGGQVYSILSTTVTSLIASGGNAYIRIGRYAYVHVTPNPVLDVGDKVTAFQTIVGTTNYKNHIHFKDGYPGAEINAIRSNGGLSPLQDSFLPSVANIRFYENATTNAFSNNRVSGLVDIVSQAYDKTNNGYSGSNNGIYRMGYQIFDSTGTTALSALTIPYQFDQIPSSDSYITNVYFSGSDISTYIYIPTNKINGDDYWDTRPYKPGPYQVMVEVEDTRHNIRRRFQKVEIVAQDVTPPAIPHLLSFRGNANGAWDLSWLPNDSSDLAGYNLEFSYDAKKWNVNTAISQRLSLNDTLLHYDNFPYNRLFFLRLSAFDDAAPVNTSQPSPPLAIMLKPQEPSALLMANIYSGRQTAIDFLINWSMSFADSDSSFSSATQTALLNDSINPGLYPLWLLETDGAAKPLLAGIEKQKIDNFLKGTGTLILAAPGLALSARLSGGDSLLNWQGLYHASIGEPIASADSIIGEAGTLFEGFRAALDTTTLPNSLTALLPGGRFSKTMLHYNNSVQSGAAIYKPRRIGNLPHDASRLLYCGFPLQSIRGDSMRAKFLRRVRLIQADSSWHIARNSIPPPAQTSRPLTLSPPYPNPARNQAALHFYLPADMLVRFNLWNMRGQKVKELLSAHLIGGDQELRIDTGRLASGLYFIRMETPGNNSIRKLLILH